MFPIMNFGKHSFVRLVSFVGAAACLNLSAIGLEVRSPDGRVTVQFAVRDFDGASGCPVFSLSYRDRPIVAPSRLGLELGNSPLRSDLRVVLNFLRKRRQRERSAGEWLTELVFKFQR